MKKYIFLFLLIPFCIASNCNKEPEEYPTYYLDQEIKDYTLFPVGSYWVYKDVVDSVIIDSLNLIWQETRISSGSDESYKSEFFIQYLSSTLNNDSISGGGSAGSLESEGLCYYSENSYPIFFSQKEIGYIFQNYLLYEAFYDSLLIYGNWYNDIKIFKFFDNNDESTIARYYFSKDIGLVKKEINDSLILELTHYNINK